MRIPGALVRGVGQLLSSSNSGTSALWKDTFWKTQHAIKCFMADKQLISIRAVSTEPYPLAG